MPAGEAEEEADDEVRHPVQGTAGPPPRGGVLGAAGRLLGTLSRATRRGGRSGARPAWAGPRAAAARGGSGGSARHPGPCAGPRARAPGGRDGASMRRAGGVMGRMIGPGRAAARWPAVRTISRHVPPARRARCVRRAPDASRGGSRRRTRQRAPLNARLATVAKPCSSSRSASSRWAMRSAAGRLGVVDAHAPAVHAPAARAHEQRARPPPPARRRAPRARARARCAACRSRASWPTRSPSRPSGGALGRRVRAAAAGASDVRAALGVELGDDPGVDERDHRHRGRERLERHQARPPWPRTARVRHRASGSTAGPCAAQPALVDPRAPVDARRSPGGAAPRLTPRRSAAAG